MHKHTTKIYKKHEFFLSINTTGDHPFLLECCILGHFFFHTWYLKDLSLEIMSNQAEDQYTSVNNMCILCDPGGVAAKYPTT